MLLMVLFVVGLTTACLSKIDTRSAELVYAVKEFVGKGSTAYVYKGASLQNELTVAIKIIPTQGLEPWAINQICVELEINERLRTLDIPVARLIGAHWNSRKDAIWMIMEWMDGVNLGMKVSEHVRKRKGEDCRPTLEPNAVRSLAKSLFSTLSVLHSLGITHEDIDTSNLMQQGRDSVVLLDFGDGKMDSAGEFGMDILMAGFALMELSVSPCLENNVEVIALGRVSKKFGFPIRLRHDWARRKSIADVLEMVASGSFFQIESSLRTFLRFLVTVVERGTRANEAHILAHPYLSESL